METNLRDTQFAEALEKRQRNRGSDGSIIDPTAHSCRVLRRNDNVSLTPFHMGDHKTAAQAFAQQALMSREKGKVRFEYKGKLLGKDIKYYDTVKKDRARYRLLLEVKKRIAFIK